MVERLDELLKLAPGRGPLDAREKTGVLASSCNLAYTALHPCPDHSDRFEILMYVP